MALETVEITVKDDTLAAALVDGVTVRVYDEAGTALITSGTTGDVLPGKVQFTLNGSSPAVRYQLRFYVNGGSIPSPQYIDVYSPASLAPTGANNFLIVAHLFELPEAMNARLCRASGYVWGPSGRLRRGIDIAFVPLFSPVVVDDIGILGERVNVKTDKDGYVEVDLLRDGMYFATVESHENVQREVAVPNRPAININHLLFPLVVDITYSPVPSPGFSVAAGGSLTVTPTIVSNDYRTLEGTAPEDVQYAVDDESIAGITVNESTITLHGRAPGTTNLRITRKDESIVYIPDPGINGAVVQITVV